MSIETKFKSSESQNQKMLTLFIFFTGTYNIFRDQCYVILAHQQPLSYIYFLNSPGIKGFKLTKCTNLLFNTDSDLNI